MLVVSGAWSVGSRIKTYSLVVTNQAKPGWASRQGFSSFWKLVLSYLVKTSVNFSECVCVWVRVFLFGLALWMYMFWMAVSDRHMLHLSLTKLSICILVARSSNAWSGWSNSSRSFFSLANNAVLCASPSQIIYLLGEWERMKKHEQKWHIT